MPSKEEVDEELRLLPWFRYHACWPDPDQCELIWLLARSMLAIQSACLVGNPAPIVQEMWEKLSHPKPGDLVLEKSSIWHEDWPERALGRLVRIETNQYDEKVYVVTSMYFTDHPETRWENASFLALPIDETLFLGRGRRVLLTRSSLIQELAESGFGFDLKQ